MLKNVFNPFLWADIYNGSAITQFVAINNSMSARSKLYIKFWVINTFKMKFKANECNHSIAILWYALLNVCKTIKIACNGRPMRLRFKAMPFHQNR